MTPGSPRVVAVILANELKRRMLDRSAVVTSFVAPLVLASILGFAFGGRSQHLVDLAVVVTAPSAQTDAVVAAGIQAAALPPQVHVTRPATAAEARSELASGRIGAFVVVPEGFGSPDSIIPLPRSTPVSARTLPDLLKNVVVGPGHGSPEARLTVTAASGGSLDEQAGEGLASAITSRLYSGALVAVAVDGLPPATEAGLAAFTQAAAGGAARPVSIAVATDAVGADASVIGYFAPSMAVVFLFISAGLATRAIALERAGGTLARLAATPVRSGAVVLGKMTAAFITSLVSILLLWGETVLLFSTSWGDRAGVALMCVAVTLSMTSLAMFLTSLVKDQEAAFGVTVIVGMLLGLLGGNFFPPGSMPTVLQDLSLATPNGWALVGFGRLSLEGQGVAGIVGPVAVLGGISAVFLVLSTIRMGRVVEL